MTINVTVKPRQDNLFDIYVGDEGDHFVNSNQGYENVEDAEAIARRLFSDPASENLAAIRRLLESITVKNDTGDLGPILNEMLTLSSVDAAEPALLTVEYRNGLVATEQLR